MNIVFKFKVLGFVAALCFGGLLHVLSGFLPGKKIKSQMTGDLEVSELDDDLRY